MRCILSPITNIFTILDGLIGDYGSLLPVAVNGQTTLFFLCDRAWSECSRIGVFWNFPENARSLFFKKKNELEKHEEKLRPHQDWINFWDLARDQLSIENEGWVPPAAMGDGRISVFWTCLMRWW